MTTVTVLSHVRKVTSSGLASNLRIILHQPRSSRLSTSSQWRSGCPDFQNPPKLANDAKNVDQIKKLADEEAGGQDINRLERDEPFKNFVESSEDLKHFTRAASPEAAGSEDYTMPHPIWSRQESEGVQITHRKPKGFVDHAAYGTVSAMRFGFDVMSGYKSQKKLDTLDEKAVLTR